MKRPAVAALLVLILTAGILLAQQDFPISQARLMEILNGDDAADPSFLGNYEDEKSIVQNTQNTNQFVFVRLIYNGRIQRAFPHYAKNWYTDYPKGDKQLIWALRRLTQLDVSEHERAIRITNPDLFKYPFIYTSEPGQMVLTKKDAEIMREYLHRGGFWMLDDFWAVLSGGIWKRR